VPTALQRRRARKPGGPAFLTQVLGSGTGKYLADQFGQPWLCRGDSLWALVNNAGYAGGATTWQSDITLYFSTRAAQGYNAVVIDCLCSYYEGLTLNYPDGSTWDNVHPWSGSIGTLNNTFWTRFDYCITQAALYGFTVFLNPADTYAFIESGAALVGMTGAQATSYGTALAARYATAPNIVWLFGNDYGGSYDTQYANILTALRAGGDTHLVTVENLTEGDSRFSDYTNAVWSFGTAHADFNAVYSYGGCYPCINYAYAESSPLAVLLADGWYDQTGTATAPAAARDFMRLLTWWSLSSGSRGYIYGDQSLISWNPHTDLTTIPFATTDLNLIWNAYAALPGWHQLVPDTSSALVTAGRGTALPVFASNTSNSYTGIPGGGNLGSARSYYVTASINPAGTLAVIYLPDATGTQNGGPISVNGALMHAGYTAWWMDPATGALTSATIASTYSHSGANSQGGADWVLVLRYP
jgi:Protein of unknown function (DUF4038)/Putative collagen-binding domain of a collagenase